MDFTRTRRNRVSSSIREIVSETRLAPDDFVLPLFVCEGSGREPVPSMPGIDRVSVEEMLREMETALEAGVLAFALFPVIDGWRKDPTGSESRNPEGLAARALRAARERFPTAVLIADVALDPFSSDGHDGLVRDGEIVNDATLPLLAEMAVVQAAAGADVIAPSDMMDGRVAAIRRALDHAGHVNTLICSYCAKYASAYYGPFRDALDSAPRGGDKKTYQMDPRNAREALREVRADEAEGADWLLVKPGLPYLDVVRRVREATALPVAAYHVSGEYAMLRAAAANGWLDYEACLLETLTAFRRAGADIVFTYAAVQAARLLK